MNDIVDLLSKESEALVRELEGRSFVSRLMAGALSTEEYAAFLVQTYYYVRWTSPLLASAAKRLREQGKSLPLAALFEEKAREERGHERWLLEDLAALGYTADEVTRIPESQAVSAYIAWNRFTVEAGSPVGFLGTAYVLEHLASRCAEAATKNLVAKSGIFNIRQAVRFLRGHGALDGDHTAELGAVLRAAATSSDFDAILTSGRVTCALYPELFATGSLPMRNAANETFREAC